MGQGRSKKIARIEAAATALRSFIQFKDGAVLTPLKPTCNLDFTSDEHLENGIVNYENLSTDELVPLLDALFRHAKFIKKLTPFMRVTDCALSMTSKYLLLFSFYFILF